MRNLQSIWFTSDTHFGHQNIIGYCRPHFASLEEMHAHLVERWNAVVKPGDLVWHLGDFAWTVKAAKEWRPKLNGTIRLIVGNHDDIPALVKARLFQDVYMWRQFREYGFTASHVPLRADQLRHGTMNLHGHVHGSTGGLDCFHKDVSVESTCFQPVRADEIVHWASTNPNALVTREGEGRCLKRH